jgi:hypothetical protein|tara:strand:- start:2563 stop:2889 length:327 start_codon:yes stop_codon:yes gene_type:complete
MTCYKFVTDDREPVMVMHQDICYPPANPDLVDQVDTSYPGILIKYENGYLLEDGVHRVAKLQKQGIFESLFYIVSLEEYKQGVVHMMFQGEPIQLGESPWNNVSPMSH